MTDVTIRRARREDATTIAEMWTRASQQLRDRGLDQWQYPVRMPRIYENIDAGTCWMLENPDGQVIGTVTVDDFADPNLWKPDDQPESAYYLHRLVLTDAERGNELGSAVLDWASRRARADGKRWLRLDAWTSNPGLHRYYLDRGFRHVRTVEGPDVVSGVLFERDSATTLNRGCRIIERADQISA
jgi:GNAT superfamily N-acetyltransferase